MDGRRVVIAYTEYDLANLGHIHAQNTSDIARTAPTGNEHTVCLGNRFCQSIYLCRIDLGKNFRHMVASLSQNLFGIHIHSPF